MRDLKKLNHELVEASKRGESETVKQLIPQSDPTFKHSLALCYAAHFGHADCVRLLIPVSDPNADNSFALIRAAYNGHSDCVALLLPVSDSTSHNSFALIQAACKGYADCVALLLPMSDPLSLDRKGLTASERAKIHGHPDIASMIDAFIEASALAASLPLHLAKPASKASL